MTTSFLHVVLPQLPPRKTSQNGGGGGEEGGEGQIQSACVRVRRDILVTHWFQVKDGASLIPRLSPSLAGRARERG